MTSPISLLFLCPSGGGTPANDAGERRLFAGSGGQGWIPGSRAVFLVVARQVGTEGVAGGELRGGGGFGWFGGFELWWSLVAFEKLGGSVRSRGNGWWY